MYLCVGFLFYKCIMPAELLYGWCVVAFVRFHVSVLQGLMEPAFVLVAIQEHTVQALA